MRFICGTFTIHRELEKALAHFVGTPGAMTYVSAWNANEGLTATVVESTDRRMVTEVVVREGDVDAATARVTQVVVDAETFGADG